MARRLARLLIKEDFRRNPIRAVWRRIYWRVHWRFMASRPFVVPFWRDAKIRLAHSTASLGIYLNDGFSDRQLAEHFFEFLKPGMVMLDCGAHVGEYTLLLASLVGPQGQVHAFEPDERVFAILRENLSRIGLQNVWAHNMALGDSEGTAEFLWSADSTSSSLAQFSREEGVRRVTIPITTVDHYVQERGLARVDALKIDVEGAEADVLTGASWTLSEHRPGFIAVECHQDPEPITRRLQAHGYRTSFLGGRHIFSIVVARR